MNDIKQRLMIKPPAKEQERIPIYIKGLNSKQPVEKSIAKTIEEGVEDLGEQISELQNIEGILPVKVDINDEKVKKDKPFIVDRTKEGFDREELLKKLFESGKAQVIIKQPTVMVQEKKIIDAKPIESTNAKKPVRLNEKQHVIIEDDDEDVVIPVPKEKPEEDEEDFFIPVPNEKAITIVPPPEKKRKTKKPEKGPQGVAVLDKNVVINMGDTDLTKRIPKKTAPVRIKVSSYMMNNREIFVNFINSLFEPYKREMEANQESISCDTIGKTSSNFSLLTHQMIVRDYMNLFTPYRGLLLYHGLGSGKTCTSIAIAEGMKDSKKIFVLTPASLRANYIGELKKCGDSLYKKNQYWEWISLDSYPDALIPMSAILNLPQEYIRKHGGAFFVNIRKKSNYDELSDSSKKVLEEQLDEMIRRKYNFINYNGLRPQKLSELTDGYTKNLFDDSVIIIDEAHNFISRIVNKLKKEKDRKEVKREDKEDYIPVNMSVKLYHMLMSANNARIILLSGTPVINYPNEFGILFNILRGYIKVWKIRLDVKTANKINTETLRNILIGEKNLDYLDYSPSSKILTITRNPFGFKNKVKVESGYQGVSNTRKNEKGEIEIETQSVNDDIFERRIIDTLKKNDIDVVPDGIEVKYKKALPDKFDEFVNRYVDESTRQLKNENALKRRILGLSSYFRSAQESLLPKFNKELGVDYHIIKVPMSDIQFRVYENAREEERKMEKKKPMQAMGEDYEEKTSTYRIFSRLYCNYVILDRPVPVRSRSEEGKEEGKEEDTNIANAIKEGNRVEKRQDLEDTREAEIEGDEILQEIGGTTYRERMHHKLKEMEANSNDFFTPEALTTYSPKFLHILENIQDEEYQGLHLVYSQFRTAEGIGLFTLVLNKNGFAQFKIKKNNMGSWEIDISEANKGKPTYALYTGTETVEEKEIVRKIYNGEWDDIPESISSELRRQYKNNNMGEVIKVFMITSSGSEGINLRNTRYVHLMDPYWHPVRSEQVIGRARRICSHKDLPVALQTVEVFVYLMTFTEAQLKSDEAIELKRKDLSKAIPKVPITSDEYLFEISEIKAKLTAQLTDAIKESAFDCYLYSNGKCVNFGDPTSDKFSYVPDFANQQNDTTEMANKRVIKNKVKTVNINGIEYAYVRQSPEMIIVYDLKSAEEAIQDPSKKMVQIGTYSKNEKGQYVFKRV